MKIDHKWRLALLFILAILLSGLLAIARELWLEAPLADAVSLADGETGHGYWVAVISTFALVLVALGVGFACGRQVKPARTRRLQRRFSISEAKATATAVDDACLASLLRAAPVGIGLLRDHLFFWVSPYLTGMLGYSEKELLGQCPRMLHSGAADYRQAIDAIDASVAAAGMGEVELRLRTKGGGLLDCLLRATLLSPQDPAQGTIFTLLDISLLHRTEASLRDTERRLELVLEATNDGIWDMHFDSGDPFHGKAYFSPRYETMLGFEPGELPPHVKGWEERVHPGDLARVKAKVDAHLAGHAPFYQAEFRFRRKDGSWAWILARGKVVEKAADGSPLRALGTHTDITERKQVEARVQGLNAELEARVEQRTRELEAVNRELESFSYSVSHDLRAPLRSIDGFSLALLEDYGDKLDTTAKGYLQRVRSASQRMGELIDDLLTLSRVNRAPLRCQTVDLSGLAREIGEELAVAEPGRVVELRVEDGLRAEADPELVRLILQNLLENAWKFTRHSPAPRIEVGFTEADGGAFFVRDNGAGFSMDYVHKLYAPFQRLHMPQDFPGTGVGLATVQRIVHRHGGRVAAKGVVDGGATFYFTLPQMGVEAEQDA